MRRRISLSSSDTRAIPAGRTRRAAVKALPGRRAGARQRLVEAAGHVFAEQGFEEATGRAICRRARTCSAAVNYYFGGMEGLHAAVVNEAHNRLVTMESFRRVVARGPDPKVQFRALIELFVAASLSLPSVSWVLKVISREAVTPSPAGIGLLKTEGLPGSAIVSRIVGGIMKLPPGHPAVARACLTVLSPCLLIAIYDRRTMRRLFPALRLGPDHAPDMVEHLYHYGLSGLSAAARRVRREE